MKFWDDKTDDGLLFRIPPEGAVREGDVYSGHQ